jgi:hypothetical protein
MPKIDVSETVEEYLKENAGNFAILIQGSFKENEQRVSVDFYSTPLKYIEPALGFAMNQNDTFLKGVLGGINSEFEYYRQTEQKPKEDNGTGNSTV